MLECSYEDTNNYNTACGSDMSECTCHNHGTCNTGISSEHKNTSRPTCICTLMDTVDNTACGSESSNHRTSR